MHPREGSGRGPTADRAVSPAVAVALLVAIVVVLAVASAAVLTGFQDELVEPAPPTSFDEEYVASGEGNDDHIPYVNVTNRAGRTLDGSDVLVRDDAGNAVAWEDVWLGGSEVRAGEYVHVDGHGSDGALKRICEGRTYQLVLRRGEGTTRVLSEWTADRPPDLPSASPYADGDGTPTWC
jgi:flagellin-like protein